jgi:hypothetical protein
MLTDCALDPVVSRTSGVAHIPREMHVRPVTATLLPTAVDLPHQFGLVGL